MSDYYADLDAKYHADRARFDDGSVSTGNFTPMTPLELQYAAAHCKACNAAYRYRELLDLRRQVGYLQVTIAQLRAYHCGEIENSPGAA